MSAEDVHVGLCGAHAQMGKRMYFFVCSCGFHSRRCYESRKEARRRSDEHATAHVIADIHETSIEDDLKVPF